MASSFPDRSRRRGFRTPALEPLEGRLLLSRASRFLPAEPPADRAELLGAIAERREVGRVRLGGGPGESRAPAPERPGSEARLPVSAARHHPGERTPIAALSARWSWLEDTYWIVPPANLPAILYSPTTDAVLPVSDQTVFHITGYRAGYFWGITVAQFDGGTPSSSSVLGSVTPEGRVLLNFTTQNESSSPMSVQGIGQMRRQYGQWTMENQMFSTPSDQVQIGHWAYMVRTRPGLPSWESLPGVGVSVPEFLSNYPGSGPQPVL